MTLALRIRAHALRLLACAALALALPALAAPQLIVPFQGAAPKNAQLRHFHTPGAAVTFNAEALKGLRPGDTVDLTLPDGSKHTLVFDRLEDHGNGITSWIGHYQGTPDELRSVITTGPTGSYGRIATPQREYRLVPGPGHDWLVDMEAERPYLPPIDLGHDMRMPPPMPQAPAARPKRESLPAAPDTSGGTTLTPALTTAAPSPTVVVDVLVLYTNGLAADLGSGLPTRIANLIAATNTALVDSEVAITVRLVGTSEVNYPDDYGDPATNVDSSTALNDLYSGAGAFSGVAALRTQLGADLVALLRDGPATGGDGVGYVANGPMGPGFAPYMYSVTTGCTASCEFVFIHELGHNMGNMHDRATTAWENGGTGSGLPTGSYPYSYGYYSCLGGRFALTCDAFGGLCVSQPECNTSTSTTNNFADIMAYFHNSTLRNVKFSNPNVTCRGSLGQTAPCGSPDGQPDSANNALSMNNNRVALAALLPTKVKSSSTAVVSSSVNPSNAGQSVTFSAAVSGGYGTPTGTVDFRSDGLNIAGCAGIALSAGAASCASAGLASGTHSVTAVYAGDTMYNGSTSLALAQKVNPPRASATVGLGSTQNPSVAGSTVTFTASVTGSSGTPTGTVDFLDGAAAVGGCSGKVLTGGTATCSTSVLAVGSHSIAARYSGDTTYNAALSASLAQVVNPAPVAPAIAIASAHNPSQPGETATFTARVSGSAGTASGTATFLDGATVLCSSAALDGSGAASCSSAALATGSHSITVQYSGNAGYTAATSAAFTQIVQTNVALASAGAVATASTFWDANYPPSAVIDGNRAGTGYGAGGVWSDATRDAFPDWLQVQFAAARTIDRVVVYSMQDGYSAPVNPDDSLTFNYYGASAFDVQAWNGSAWATVASVTGNNLVKRMVTFPAVSTDRIRVVVNAAAGRYSLIAEVEAWTSSAAAAPPPPATPTNVAAASAGATASASSTWNASYPVSALIDGDRAGLNYGAGGVWSDATRDAFPDTVQVQFGATNTINRVVVYSMQDNYSAPVDPSDSATFTYYGATAFDVQAWNGSAWVTVASVTGNNLVKRTVTFPAVSTDRIQVVVNAAKGRYSLLSEIEAWTPGTTATDTNLALASAGGVATASSVWSASYPASAVNDGERAGLNYGAGGVWSDATRDTFPDWIQIQLASTKSIDKVVVYSMQDNYSAPVDPSDTATFTYYGATAFDVQAWNGSAWTTVASVTGNSLVKRSVTFPAVSTNQVRVVVNGAKGRYTLLSEVEVWGQ